MSSKGNRILRVLYPVLLVLMGTTFSACAPKSILPSRVLYPVPPETPRVEFIGAFANEEDMKHTSMDKFTRTITGSNPSDRFVLPFDIAVDKQHNVYVSDPGDRNVKVFDFEKRHVHYLMKESSIERPAGLKFDADDNLYVCDASSGKVYVFAPGATNPSRVISHERLTVASYLAINQALGRLYVVDGKSQRVVVFDLAGNYLFDFGEGGADPGKLYGAQGIAIAPDGKVVICEIFNSRVSVFDPDGKFIRVFGERGDDVWQFDHPKACAFDSEGHLYVLDSRKGMMVIYTTEGELLLVVGEGKPTAGVLGFSLPTGIFVDENDRIYVADMLARRFVVWQYLSKGYLDKNPVTDKHLQEIRDYLDRWGKKDEKSPAKE